MGLVNSDQPPAAAAQLQRGFSARQPRALQKDHGFVSSGGTGPAGRLGAPRCEGPPAEHWQPAPSSSSPNVVQRGAHEPLLLPGLISPNAPFLRCYLETLEAVLG